MATSTQSRGAARHAGERSVAAGQSARYTVIAGLLIATIGALLLSHLPASQTPSTLSLFFRAILDVTFTGAAGALGVLLFWHRSSIRVAPYPSLSFSQFALANGVAWVWLPAVVLLALLRSPASPLFSGLGAALLAFKLRAAIPSTTGSALPQLHTQKQETGELFTSILRSPPRDTDGYVTALCLYATGCLFANHFYLISGAPFALAVFLIVWNLTPARPQAPSPTARAAARLTPVAVTAVLVTLCALLLGAHLLYGGLDGRTGIAANSKGGVHQNNRRPATVVTSGLSGYHSIILWPAPQKKQIVLPLPAAVAPYANQPSKPIIIRFDGPYWYFQAPLLGPGRNAHESHGDPLAVNIASDNFAPLNMEAIQTLSAPIRLSGCRELQVDIENRDNSVGPVELGIQLSDSSEPGKPYLSLGRAAILSSLPENFSIKTASTDEVLHFEIPAHANLQKFDKITVVYLPGPERWMLGAKIAIRQFEILPL